MEILVTNNINVVDVPAHVLAAIRRYAPFNLSLVTPTLVASAYQSVQSTLGLHWESKVYHSLLCVYNIYSYLRAKAATAFSAS